MPTFQLEKIDYQQYQVIADGNVIGTITIQSRPSVAVYYYQNDKVSGTMPDIGAACMALYNS